MDLHRIRLLRNPIRNYDWGSRTAIANLLGEPSPSAEPQAELWMGAHPSAPSMVLTEASEVPLDEWIARDPEGILGAEVAARFDGKLPFLFKVLAIERPLSVQAHPNRQQAAEGFARESAAGIPVDAPNRCYRDSNHKPELICALTPFEALCRFREIPETLARFEALNARELAEPLAALRGQSDRDGLAQFFRTWMTLAAAPRRSVLARALEVAADEADDDPGWAWVVRLAELYPGDVGVLAPLFLNVVTLEPGEAMFLDVGELHCYLGGVGIEVMANSDNVLRGGLTKKHVDVKELLSTLTFATGPAEKLVSVRTETGEELYATPIDEFCLAVHRVIRESPRNVSCDRGAEIILCTEGSVRIRGECDDSPSSLERGESAFVPASAGCYMLEGVGTLFRATAGLDASPR